MSKPPTIREIDLREGFCTINVENMPNVAVFALCTRSVEEIGFKNVFDLTELPASAGEEVSCFKFGMFKPNKEHPVGPGKYVAVVMAKYSNGILGKPSEKEFELSEEEAERLRRETVAYQELRDPAVIHETATEQPTDSPILLVSDNEERVGSAVEVDPFEAPPVATDATAGSQTLADETTAADIDKVIDEAAAEPEQANLTEGQPQKVNHVTPPVTVKNLHLGGGGHSLIWDAIPGLTDFIVWFEKVVGTMPVDMGMKTRVVNKNYLDLSHYITLKRFEGGITYLALVRACSGSNGIGAVVMIDFHIENEKVVPGVVPQVPTTPPAGTSPAAPSPTAPSPDVTQALLEVQVRQGEQREKELRDRLEEQKRVANLLANEKKELEDERLRVSRENDILTEGLRLARQTADQERTRADALAATQAAQAALTAAGAPNAPAPTPAPAPAPAPAPTPAPITPVQPVAQPAAPAVPAVPFWTGVRTRIRRHRTPLKWAAVVLLLCLLGYLFFPGIFSRGSQTAQQPTVTTPVITAEKLEADKLRKELEETRTAAVRKEIEEIRQKVAALQVPAPPVVIAPTNATEISVIGDNVRVDKLSTLSSNKLRGAALNGHVAVGNNNMINNIVGDNNHIHNAPLGYPDDSRPTQWITNVPPHAQVGPNGVRFWQVHLGSNDDAIIHIPDHSFRWDSPQLMQLEFFGLTKSGYKQFYPGDVNHGEVRHVRVRRRPECRTAGPLVMDFEAWPMQMVYR